MVEVGGRLLQSLLGINLVRCTVVKLNEFYGKALLEHLKKNMGKIGIKSLVKKEFMPSKINMVKKWFDITLKRGREQLRKRYGENWQKYLSNLAMESLENRYGKDFHRKIMNQKKMMKSCRLTKTESEFVNLLVRNEIRCETHCFVDGSEFDILIPDYRNPEVVCEISNQKPNTHTLRRKIAQLYFQKKVFPKAKFVCIFRKFGVTKGGKKSNLNPSFKKFLISNNITLFYLEQMHQAVHCIKNFINGNKNAFSSQNQNIIEEIKNEKRFTNSSIGGAKAQVKKTNQSEVILHEILKKIGNPCGPTVMKLPNGYALAVDNYEEVGNEKMAYEITTTRGDVAIQALVGKFVYLKNQMPNVKTIAILESIKSLSNNIYSHRQIREVSNVVINGKLNKKKLLFARNRLIK